jgi:hypothetical protein
MTNPEFGYPSYFLVSVVYITKAFICIIHVFTSSDTHINFAFYFADITVEYFTVDGFYIIPVRYNVAQTPTYRKCKAAESNVTILFNLHWLHSLNPYICKFFAPMISFYLLKRSQTNKGHKYKYITIQKEY